MKFLGILILVIIIIVLGANLMTDAPLSTYAGIPTTLESFYGTPLVVNAWASWCIFCKQELPDFIELQKEFGDRITVIAINRAESLETAQGFSDALEGHEEITWLLDPTDSFYTSIGGFGMPETQFINADGTVVTHKRGFMSLEEMRDLTQNLLNQ